MRFESIEIWTSGDPVSFSCRCEPLIAVVFFFFVSINLKNPPNLCPKAFRVRIGSIPYISFTCKGFSVFSSLINNDVKGGYRGVAANPLPVIAGENSHDPLCKPQFRANFSDDS